MITEENIHKFWRAVSNACDSSPNDRNRIEEYETRAMLAFTEVLNFCDDLPFDQKGKNTTALEFLKSTTSNDGTVSFDMTQSMDSDIYARGMRLAQITCRQYTPSRITP